jgi:hypothetical protein
MSSIDVKSKTTVGVNAAFLQEVKDSNPQLWATLRDLRELAATRESSPAVSRVFVTRLGELRDCLGLGFSLEETYGYIEGGTFPSSLFGVADAATAKMQHRDLYLQLHELCETVEEAQYRGTICRDLPMFKGTFEAFDCCFRAHEDLEAELIRCSLGFKRSR